MCHDTCVRKTGFPESESRISVQITLKHSQTPIMSDFAAKYFSLVIKKKTTILLSYSLHTIQFICFVYNSMIFRVA